jgi:peptide-methionine (S)-S-oxide reductase
MALFSGATDLRLPRPDQALPGRAAAIPVPDAHFVNGHPLTPPFAAGLQQAVFGMGCFWGAERKFWQAPGVYSTAVGYAGGYTPNANYREVCSGMTGHTEVVLVVFDPQATSYEAMLKLFWENHDPTQGMRQGNDAGTQYRSAICCSSPDQVQAAAVARAHQDRLTRPAAPASPPDRRGAAVLLRRGLPPAVLAEEPNGYCGLGGTGVTCQVGVLGL